MFKFHKRLGPIVILGAALCAPSAQAVVVNVDPGVVGNPATSPLEFNLGANAAVIDLKFTDMKHLELGPVLLEFLIINLSNTANVAYNGFLSDEFGSEIPDTAFVGITQNISAQVTLQDDTVWHDMHFTATTGAPFRAGNYRLDWVGRNRPLVGEWTSVPEPATGLLFGAAMVSLAWMRRKAT